METKIIEAQFIGNAITSNSKKAYSEFNQFSFGEKIEDKIKYSFSEAMFLIQNGKMELYANNKTISPEEAIKKFTKLDKKFITKYAVFKDLRLKGYIVKTALKFGAEFRIYEKGKKIGKSHAKWILFTDIESNKTSWHELSAKMRVAHSTGKSLLLAIVDDEQKVSYYEINWIKT